MAVSGVRHNSRVLAMKALFAYHMHCGNPDEIFSYTKKEFGGEPLDPQFASYLFHGVIEKEQEIENILQEHAPKWPLAKIPPVDRAVLEIGVFELLGSKDVPQVVAINEAIEIAKAFGSENSPKFVNGVLSSIMKSSDGKR